MFKRIVPLLFVCLCGLATLSISCTESPKNQQENTADGGSKSTSDSGNTGKCWWCDDAGDSKETEPGKETTPDGTVSDVDPKCMDACAAKGVSKTECIGYCWKGDKSDVDACTAACTKAGGPKTICAKTCSGSKDPGKDPGKGDEAKACYDKCIKAGGTTKECEPKCYKGGTPGGKTPERICYDECVNKAGGDKAKIDACYPQCFPLQYCTDTCVKGGETKEVCSKKCVTSCQEKCVKDGGKEDECKKKCTPSKDDGKTGATCYDSCTKAGGKTDYCKTGCTCYETCRKDGKSDTDCKAKCFKK